MHLIIMQYYVYGNVTIFFVAGNTIFTAFAQMQKKNDRFQTLHHLHLHIQVCTDHEGAFI